MDYTPTGPVKDDERKANCAVAPNGDWYNIGYVEHEEFFRWLLDKEGWTKTRKTPKDTAVFDHGWISVEDHWMTGTIVSAPKMTRRQYQRLKSAFLDQPLFRFRTIDDIYADAEHPDGD